MVNLNEYKHLVLYDGDCAFCNQMIQYLIHIDKNKKLIFSSLQGKTAKKFNPLLKENFYSPDSIVLIENFNTNPSVTFYGKAVLRILWIIGGFWTLLGWISFLPKIIYDPAYRIFARHRHQFLSKKITPLKHKESDRFLP